MKFHEALRQAVDDGETIRKVGSPPDERFKWTGSKLVDVNGDVVSITSDYINGDWEIHEETIPFIEAYTLMKEGKKVRRRSWPAGHYLLVDKSTRDIINHEGRKISSYTLTAILDTTDWVEVVNTGLIPTANRS